MLSILNNTAATQAQQSLNMTNGNLATALQRLSTGLKINSGADGPAAYVISQAQQAQVAGLNQAVDNTNQAISLVQTGSGALNEINNLLTQVRGLALDSANAGVNNSGALQANQSQISNALNTITQIATSTQFNGKQLLDGSAGFNAISNGALSGLNASSNTTVGNYTVAITNGAQKAQVDTAASTVSNQLDSTHNLAQNENLIFNGNVVVSLQKGMTNTEVVSAINAQTSQTGAVASLDSSGRLELTATNFGTAGNFTVVSDTAASGSTGLGTTVSDTSAAPAGLVTQQGQDISGTITDPKGNSTSFTGMGNVVNITTGEGTGLSFTVNADATNSSISDANTTANGANITVNDGTLQFQIGANSGQTAKLDISKVTADALGTGVANNQFSNLSQIDVTTAKGATDAIGIIDQAISQVSTLGATLGAFQSNTLQANATNLQTALTNTQSAEATITNTDFATEISKYTSLQTQMQAGSSVLSNANQASQYITQMLQRL
jgi:flagellin